MLHFLFNVLRLLFILCDSMFQDFPSLTHTKNSLYFHSSFSHLLFYIHMSIAFHTILSQIHLDKKWCHLASTFQWHLHNSNVVVSFDLTRISKLWPMKGACVFYLVTVAYDFDVEVRHCRFCEGYDSLRVFGCSRFWFGKVINVFYLN